jgi:hypothetical protein
MDGWRIDERKEGWNEEKKGVVLFARKRVEGGKKCSLCHEKYGKVCNEVEKDEECKSVCDERV